MEFYPFPALLRAEYNGVCEYGQARVAPGGNAVDFTGDFVPLLPLGAAAAVCWVYGQKTVAEYGGKVYLSTAQLVRIVEVDPALMAPSRDIFAANTSLPAAIAPAVPAAPQHTLGATVLYLSVNTIRLLVPRPVGQGRQLRLQVEVDFLTLRDLVLKVRQQVPLRRGEILLVCDVPRGSDENLIALSAYAARLEQLPKQAVAE